ncbi:MAG: amidohydrolase family protein, partial [Gemmatimonadota bacterium]|nr:amidohydrolase family protein [Gemmatimonadota bacterium]
GRIAEIIEGTRAPEGVPTLDGTGKTLLASMMDNHYHYWSPHDGERLIARGITAVRDPGVAISESMSFKDAIAYGLVTGPDIYTAGPLIDGEHGYHPRVDVTITDPARAPALVRALHEQGVDALKAYFMLDRGVLAAVVAEADELGIPVTGHIGVRTGWREAMEAGIDGFSHIRVWRDFLSAEQQPLGLDMTLDGGRNPTARMQSDWRDIDPDSPETEELIERMVRAGVSLDATLAIQKVGDDARERFSPELFTVGRNSYDLMGRFVRNVNEAGVPLLAGTDNIHLVDELEAYAEFGIPNADILRAATINGARWIGRGDEFGTVEVGKRANLLLVDGDPLTDVSVLRNISAVIKNGIILYTK